MKKKLGYKIPLAILLPLLIGVLLLVGLLQAKNLANANLPSPTPTISDSYLRSLDAEINRYNKQLNKKNLNPQTQKKIEARKKYVEAQATERASYLSTPEEVLLSLKETSRAEKPSPQTTKSSKETRKLGLQEFVYFPFIRDAKLSSAWVEPNGDSYIQYFTGSMVEDADQGVVYVFDEKTMTLKKFIAPGKNGELKIKSLEKNILELDSKKGKKLLFYTDTKNFTDDQGNPLPTIQVIATPTHLPAYP